jgi:hypothetical protein
MGKALRASVLILLLTCSAHAGYMPNGSPEPPPPTPPGITQEQELTAGGVMQNDEPESLTEAVLTVLESVLSIF